MPVGLGADFAALVARFSPDPQDPIGVGVSGGSDSMALMYLLADWADKAGRAVLVLSVDHGLRPEARAEIETVAEAAGTLGLAHEMLVWRAPQGGQSAARDARHRLLADASRRAGARLLALAHTRDDVCETIMIRKRRRAQLSRLAGPARVAPCPVWPEGRGLTLIRPLLHHWRAELQDELRARGVGWVNDPSNEVTKHERVRVRQFLARHPRLQAVLASKVAGLLAQRQIADRALGRALDEAVRVHDDGVIEVCLTGLECGISLQLLQVLLRIAGGHDRPPRREGVIRLLAHLQKPGARHTLAGAWVQATRTGCLIGRDPAAVGRVDAAGLWDGRFEPAGHDGQPRAASILVRANRPPDASWQPVLAERIGGEARAYCS